MESWLYSFLKHAKYLEQCLTHSKCPQSISSYESTSSCPHSAMPAVCPVSVLVLESSPASPVCTPVSHWKPLLRGARGCILSTQLQCVPLWPQSGWMPLFATSGGGASLSPHGFPTSPSQHRGSLHDPSHLPLHLERFSVASLITFPKPPSPTGF